MKINNASNYDYGADLLLFHPENNDISMIIQIKNHVSPLNITQTRNEIRRFEEESASRYNCNNFILISLNGYTESAKNTYSKYSCRLESWSYVEALIRTYDINPGKPSIELNNHNQIAFNNILNVLEKSNLTYIDHATGTGKSYIIAQLLCHFNNEQKLVLAPTQFILQQIQNIVPWIQKNTIFMTYSKALTLTTEELKNLNISLLILDEFHHIGAKRWSLPINEILNSNKNVKVVGTSATPIRYLERRDMGEEFFHSNLASELSLYSAIAKKILTAPKYISSIYHLNLLEDKLKNKIDSAEINTDVKENQKLKLKNFLIDFENTRGIPIILKKHLNPSKNKFIIYCESVDQLAEAEWLVKSWFQKAKIYSKINTYTIHYNTKNNEKTFENFKNNSEKNTVDLLFNVNMLTEGVHPGLLSGIILIRKTASLNLYLQIIGRVFDIANKDTPIIFDFVNNFELLNKDFINNINSAIDLENQQRTKDHLEPVRIPVLIEDYTLEITALFNQIEQALSQKWDKQLLKLIQFKNEHGHCLVPITYSNDSSLAYWVNAQRTQYNNNQLSQYRIETLNSIGFIWKPLDIQWQNMFNELVKFKSLNGHCIVPDRSPEYPKLSNWLRVQRSNYQKNTLDIVKKNLLNDIGFAWVVNDHTWNLMYSKLKTLLHEENKLILDPYYKIDDSELTTWMKNQRTYYRKNTLSSDKVDLLNKIGFIWDIEISRWMHRYNELKEFQQINGHINVPSKQLEYMQLHTWLGVQREKWTKGTLSNDKLDLLNTVGFQFNPYEQTWQTSYAKLVSFYNDNGHTMIPDKWAFDPDLATWVGTQRYLYNKGKLDPKKINQLNKINFIWDVNEYKWIDKFKQLENFISIHNKTKVPREGEYHQLAMWIKKQRAKVKDGKLDDNKLQMLRALGLDI